MPPQRRELELRAQAVDAVVECESKAFVEGELKTA